jgi:hypothetical protein
MNRRFWLASALTALSLVCLIVLSISAQTGTKDQGKGKETGKETKKETGKETKKETGKETPKETKKETPKETKKETPKETKKETGKETPKETGKEATGGELRLSAFETKGKPFVQKLETKTNQVMNVSGMKNVQNQEQTFWYEWIPEGTKDGKYVVKQKILGLKMDIDIGGNKIAFDSGEKDQKKNPMTQFFKALEKAEFTITIDPKTMKVTEVKGVKELVDNLSSVNAAMKPLLEKILSEDAMKQMAAQFLSVVPPDGVVPKDKTWGGKEETLDMGPIGAYKTTNKYTLKGTDKGIADIHVTTNLKYVPPADNAAGGLPFKIEKGSNLESKKGSEGDIQFDKQNGRVKSSKLKVILKGNLKINIAGTTVPVDLDQTQDVLLTTFDSNAEGLPAFVTDRLKEK